MRTYKLIGTVAFDVECQLVLDQEDADAHDVRAELLGGSFQRDLSKLVDKRSGDLTLRVRSVKTQSPEYDLRIDEPRTDLGPYDMMFMGIGQTHSEAVKEAVRSAGLHDIELTIPHDSYSSEPQPQKPHARAYLYVRLPAGMGKVRDPAPPPEPDKKGYDDAKDLLAPLTDFKIIEDPFDAKDEVYEVDQICQDKHLWRELDDSDHSMVMSQVTARLRHAQDLTDDHALLDHTSRRISGLFKSLTAHSEDARPGFIHGLAKSHEPKHGEWVDDAIYWTHEIKARIREMEEPEGPSQTDFLNVMEQEDDPSTLARQYKEEGFNTSHPRFLSIVTPHRDKFEGHIRNRIDAHLEDDDSGQRFDSVRQAASQAARDFDHILDVYKSAIKSADKADFNHPDQVYEALEAIASVGLEYVHSGGHLGNTWKHLLEERGLNYKASDTEATKSKKARTFQGVEMDRHLTIGEATDVSIQIYFKVSDDIQVGYIGPHLRYATQ